MSTFAPAVAAPAEHPRVRDALRAALRDFWENSWRLVLLNAGLSLAALGLAAAAAVSLLALALVPLLGVLAAGLAHCAVTLAQTGELRLGCALSGLRLHWRRGLALGLLATLVVFAGLFAIDAYASSGHTAWPLAFCVAYLLIAFAALQLHVWPLAVAQRSTALGRVLRRALWQLGRRPGATLRLAGVLLLVNLAGIAAGVMPFLTLTIAYSFLTTAHFALPPSRERQG